MSVRDGESGRDVVLVLGATYNQVPLIRKVQQMGLGAWATGAGDTSECEGVADRVLQIDTSDVGAILDLVRGGPIRGLVTCGTATAICTIATINAELGLSRTVIAPRVAEDAAIKENFRRILGPAALVPRGAVVSEFEELLRAADELSFPLVLKPVDTGGGKGVEVVSGPGENLVQAYARSIAHCRSGRLIVEEFVEGVTFGVESITIAGEVHVLAVAEKTLTGFPHCVTTGVIFPSERLEPHLEAIERVNRDTIARLGIEWGPTHIDMVLSESGEPIVIDVGPRLAGGPIASTLIESATGYDYYRATIDLSLGRPVEAPRRNRQTERLHGSHFVTRDAVGTISALDYDRDLVESLDLHGFRLLKKVGDRLRGVTADGDRLAVFHLSADSRAEMEERIRRMDAGVSVRVS